MDKTQKQRRVRFRPTRNFKASLGVVWDGIRALPQLKAISDERLEKELFFVWQVGGNYLQRPARPERLRRCVASGQEAVVALDAFLENLRKLLHNYDVRDFDTTYDIHPLYGAALGPKLELPKLASDIMDVMPDIGIAIDVFAQMSGIRMVDGKAMLKRKFLTSPLVNIVHIVMKSWLGLTGEEFVFAKGIESRTPSEKPTIVPGGKHRPLQDDAYFACLCIQLVTGQYDPSMTITAINRARTDLKCYRDALAEGDPDAIADSGRIDTLNKRDDEMRRTLYQLEYKSVRHE